IVDAKIPVAAAHNCLGLHRRDSLRHDPNIGRVAPQGAIAIEIDAPVDFSDLSDIALQANVGYRTAAALRELEAASERSNFLFVEYVECPQSDVRYFLLVENGVVARFGVLRLDIRCGR